MPLLLEQVSPSRKVLIHNLEFYTKIRSRFGLLFFTYLIAQRFFLLWLQVNYLRCPYDNQEKLSSYVQEKGFSEWYAACINYYHNYSYDIWKSWNQQSTKSTVGGVNFPVN